jgi:hypothetical protein
MKAAVKLALILMVLSAALSLTAQPADALSCVRTFMGCPYNGVVQYENSRCCTYNCPGGWIINGVCEVTYPPLP